MKNYLLFTILGLCLLASSTSAQDRSIQFEHGTWQEIKAKAARERKLIFLDAYTSWCGPCKWMTANVFTDNAVADYFNEHFVNAKIDMEVGEGKEIAKVFKVNAYPSLIFADADGAMVHRGVGARPATEFIDFGKDALSPDKAYGALVKKYESGACDAAFMIKYLNATANAGMDTKAAARAYFATQKESDLISRDNWGITCNFLSDVYGREFKYLLANRSTFEKKYGKDTVSMFLYKVYTDACNGIIFNKSADPKKYLELKQEIKKTNFLRRNELLLTTDLSYYRMQGDWSKYIATAEVLLRDYPAKDPEERTFQLNEICWTCFENVDDKALLAKAVKWAKQSLDLEDAAFIDTYANLLFKSGDKKGAIKAEEAAIALLKKSPNPSFSLTDAEAALAKFKQ